ncbi:MAG: M48 family metallopeptidase [Clostridia bacterium]|nr:M48 family metallopeptidase [Clostridia bacterium]
MNFKILALAILFVVYLWNLFLYLLKRRSANNPIPENVADVYDTETYKKWQAYNGEKTRLSIFQGTASFLVSALLMAFDAYALFARLFAENAYAQMFGVLLLSALSDVLLLPFHYYDIMKIEGKYGFNRTTKKTFWLDQLKEFVISLGLISFVGWLLITVHQALGDWLILAFAGGMTAIMLLFSFLYPFFSKIFNKFTPLEDGELKERITALLEKNGYRVRAIQVMDASRRSTKSNAYFTGFGKMKTIVLYDTLVQAMTTDEICAVFAHEMGHGLHKDTLKNQILTFVQMLIIGVLAWLTLRSPELFRSFGFDKVNYGFAILLIMSVEFALIAPLFGLLVNWHSRRAEYRADKQAVKEGCGDALISALKKLAWENFADLSPHPLLVKLEYSHPTLSQRIEAIQKQA